MTRIHLLTGFLDDISFVPHKELIPVNRDFVIISVLVCSDKNKNAKMKTWIP